ncbi:uncharacterized protein LOC141528968 [Cotesia typhae]|uniref:uncharacterized protein LOC141528968 n=1 Tax=Cotesia typhae TaxID=2053667 RepID=UPI003D69F849
MCDYEQAMRNAVKGILPKAKLQGCFFHRVQALQKYAQEIGFWKKIKDDEEARKHFRLLMAVATLPAERMHEGFETVKRKLPQKYAAVFEPMFQYYEKNWLVKRDSQKMSVWKTRNNTNNYCESYHAWLASVLQRRLRPWKLIRVLLDKMDESERKLKSIEEGYDPSRKNIKNLISKGIMNEAAEKLEQNVISLTLFLKQMSNQLQKRKHNFEEPSDGSASEEEIEEQKKDESLMVQTNERTKRIRIISNEQIALPSIRNIMTKYENILDE